MTFLYGPILYHRRVEHETEQSSIQRFFTGWGRDLAVAGAFLTRLPFKPTAPVAMADLGPAARAFPLIGLLIGAVGGGALWLGAQINLHPMACAIIGLAAAAWTSGALHEDGLADFADGLGARDRARRLEIMRDSRIGTFGVLALIFTVGLKATILAGFLGPGLSAVALLAAAAISRGAVPMLMHSLTAARSDGLGRDAGRPGSATAGIAMGISLLIAFVCFNWQPAVLALLMAACAVVMVGWLAHRRLGGYTGDVLGAAQQAAEVAVLMAAGVYAS